MQIIISVKGLLPRIYKELTQTSLIENIKNSTSENTIQFEIGKKKKKKNFNRQFCKEDIQIVNKRMQRYSISLVIRETHMKMSMKYYFMPTKLARIKATENSQCW